MLGGAIAIAIAIAILDPLSAITVHSNNHQAVWMAGYVFQVLTFLLEARQLSLVFLC